MRFAPSLILVLTGCSPLGDAGVRMVGIDLLPVPITAAAPELDGLDLDAIAASTGRVEVQPLYDDGFIEDASLPVVPDGLGYYGVLGFVEDERDALDHGHDAMPVEPADFPWDAIVGPLRREEDGHTSVLFFASDADPFDLAALRTAQIVVSAAEPTPETATLLLAGEFEFVDAGAVTTGHSHGP